MKVILTTIAAAAIGFLTTVAYADTASNPPGETTMQKIENSTRHVAKSTERDTKIAANRTWTESKLVGRSVVDSPKTAYHVMRGDRPLFPNRTASRRAGGHREQIALSGHRATKASSEKKIEPAPESLPQ
jgi:hypothetical protein